MEIANLGTSLLKFLCQKFFKDATVLKLEPLSFQILEKGYVATTNLTGAAPTSVDTMDNRSLKSTTKSYAILLLMMLISTLCQSLIAKATVKTAKDFAMVMQLQLSLGTAWTRLNLVFPLNLKLSIRLLQQDTIMLIDFL